MQYDKSLVKALLARFVDDSEYSTHSLSFCASSFTGKDNRSFLRKYLRYCEDKGYVINHRNAHNYHSWNITQDGKDALALLESDYFIH